MFRTHTSSSNLELESFRQSQIHIRRLKARLPDDLVANLALEAIRRLSARDSSIDDVPRDPSPEELEELCIALISDDDTAAAEMISGVQSSGTPVEAVYLKYLAAAARILGDWWIADKASFVDVTVGAGRMIAIMRSMRHLFEPDPHYEEKAAIFASVPGEDHTLGVRMAADLFRKDGWEIALKIGLDHDELVAEIERTPSSIVGLSIGGRHSVGALSKLVVALHICRPNASILVSGHDIDEIRPLLSLMGLHGIAGSIEEAKEQMTAMWLKKTDGRMPARV